MGILSILLESAPTGLANDLVDLLPAGGLVAFAVVCVRLAVGAYKDNASQSNQRERTCATTLAGITPATQALAEEVRRNSAENRALMDGKIASIDARLASLERGVAALLEHHGSPRG